VSHDDCLAPSELAYRRTNDPVERRQLCLAPGHEQYRADFERALGWRRCLEVPPEPGPDDVHAELFPYPALCQGRSVEVAPVPYRDLDDVEVVTDFDGVTQVRADAGREFLCESPPE